MFAPSTKVLIIDDMSTMRKIVKKICIEIGFSDFIEAADGNLAWTAITTAINPVGLIISDWNMPNCTGLELLKKIRSDEKYKSTPFILVTAEAEKDQVMDALKSGVDQYVVKPFTRDDLVKKLEMVHRKYAKAK
jgi:two-component system chemotaxis response regulator CheY